MDKTPVRRGSPFNLGYTEVAMEKKSTNMADRRPTKSDGTPLTTREIQGQIDVLKRKLSDMRAYKRLIAADGLEPDAEDKRLESELIVRLLYLEKHVQPGTFRNGSKTKPKDSRSGNASPARGGARTKSRPDRRKKNVADSAKAPKGKKKIQK